MLLVLVDDIMVVLCLKTMVVVFKDFRSSRSSSKHVSCPRSVESALFPPHLHLPG